MEERRKNSIFIVLTHTSFDACSLQDFQPSFKEKKKKKEVNIFKSRKGITGGITKRCDHSTHSLTPREERVFEVISKTKKKKKSG